MAWEKLPVQAWYRAVGEMQHMEEDRRRGQSEDGTEQCDRNKTALLTEALHEGI